MRRVLCLALLLFTAPVSACVVQSVQDGDTLTARCAEGILHVRLREIDAPERTQPYSRLSTNHLKHLCLGKPVELRERGLDRYGRTLARVHCAGVDANLRQVQRGLAWAFDKYLDDPAIKVAESHARARRVGLWAGKSPQPPWEFREQRRATRG